MAKTAESLLLPLQKQQADHDDRAHRDILALDTQTRIKHMVLHFLKYVGKAAEAKETGDQASLERALLDAFVICLATANSLNVSLGEGLGEAEDLKSLVKSLARDIHTTDLFSETVYRLSRPAGRMAKAVESSDHWEKGDFRGEMEKLIVELTKNVMGLIGKSSISDLPSAVQSRWEEVERKNIFHRLNRP